jgi:hypothetical protein
MNRLSSMIPTIGFVVGTRAALAFGAGLLVSERMAPARRHALGRGLVAAGILTTVPAMLLMRRHLRGPRQVHRREGRPVATVEQDNRLRGIERFPRKGDDPF